MANPTGFKQFTRAEIPHRPVSERIKDWYEIDQPLVEQRAQRAGGALHGLRHSVLPRRRMPGEEPHPGVQRPGLSRPLAGGGREPALDEQLSRSDRPGLPCPLRSGLHAGDQRSRGEHQAHRVPDRRTGLPAKAGSSRSCPTTRTGKRVAVIGSGPAGLAAAQQINRAGHETVVFEKDDRIGGLLRYGIPDFKLEKRIIDRRLEQMSREGVRFQSGVEVGRDITAAELRSQFDAVCLCMGAGQARPLSVTGAEPPRRAPGHGLPQPAEPPRGRRRPARRPTGRVLTAKGKHVIVVGGGDTGSDCVGTSIRQGAISVTQLEILPKPPDGSNDETPWPQWPKIMRTSSSQEEGCERRWSVLTKELRGDDGPGPRVVRHRGQLAARRQGLGNEGDSRDRIRPARRSGADRHGLPARRAERPGGRVGREDRRPRQRGGRQLDVERAGRFCRRRHGVAGRRWWSTPSIRAASWPPPWTSGCGSSIATAARSYNRLLIGYASRTVDYERRLIGILSSRHQVSPASSWRTWAFSVPFSAAAASNWRRTAGWAPFASPRESSGRCCASSPDSRSASIFARNRYRSCIGASSPRREGRFRISRRPSSSRKSGIVPYGAASQRILFRRDGCPRWGSS